MASPQPTPQQTVAQILAAQTRPVTAAQQRVQAQQASDRQQAQALTLALVHALQNGIAPVQQTYDAALGQQQALASRGAALLAGSNPNTQVQSQLAAVNAPQQQRDQLAAQASADFNPGVLYTQTGSIPGASLLAQRQAAIQHLAGLPTVAALQGQETQRTLEQQRQASLDKYLSDIGQITAQAPSLLTSLKQQAVQNQRANQQLALQQSEFANSIRQAALNRQFQAQQATLNRAAQQAVTPYERAQIALDQQRLDVAKAQAARTQQTGGSAGLQLRNLPDGSVALFNPNTGATQLIKGPKPTTGTGSLTPTQNRSVRAKANQLIANVREAKAAAAAGHVYTSGANKGQPVVAPTYDQAVQQAEQDEIPLKIAVAYLNKVYPVQYRVTARGTLKQIGIRGYPSTFKNGGKGK